MRPGGANGYSKCFAASFIFRPSCLVFPILHIVQWSLWEVAEYNKSQVSGSLSHR